MSLHEFDPSFPAPTAGDVDGALVEAIKTGNRRTIDTLLDNRAEITMYNNDARID